MQNWQKDRNYRKFENADGTLTHVITVDGVEVEVRAEVFAVYSQGDRRARYLDEREVGWLLSLERLEDDNVPPSFMADRYSESAEGEAIKKMLIAQSIAALALLSPDEQRLIQAVVMDGVSEQEYADAIGVRQSTVNKRKKRILKKIFNLLELNR